MQHIMMSLFEKFQLARLDNKAAIKKFMFKAKESAALDFFSICPTHWFFKNMQYAKEFIYKRMFVDFWDSFTVCTNSIIQYQDGFCRIKQCSLYFIYIHTMLNFLALQCQIKKILSLSISRGVSLSTSQSYGCGRFIIPL